MNQHRVSKRKAEIPAGSGPGTTAILNKNVADIFADYPVPIRSKLLYLRQLVYETAAETEGVGAIEECVKWGEPSYCVKGGSTIRVGWKDSNPNQYALYFHCKTRLIDTIKELYGDRFQFEGNRAIIFAEDNDVPVEELKHCISLSLTYHRRKHLPLLGA